MATNKFATMLHRNSHKITVILVYAVLEWTLILLLLLNSFFTYLISKFASYFGLKKPCLWCSTLDHNRESFTNLVCETHASEISRLGYCSNHHKLAEPESMCQACLASLPDHSKTPTASVQRIAFLSWVSQDSPQHGDKVCSCCNETLSTSTTCPPCFLLKPFPWDGLRYASKKGSFIMDGDDKELDKNDSIERIGQEDEHQILSDFESFSFREGGEDCSRSSGSDDKELSNESEKVSDMKITELSHQSCGDGLMMQCCFGEDSSFEVIDAQSHNYITYDDSDRLFPVELIDSSTTASQRSCNSEKEDLREHECQDETFDADPVMESDGNLENIVSLGEPSDPQATEDEQLDEQAKSENFERVEANDHKEPSSMTDNENGTNNFDSQDAYIEENAFGQEHTVETSLEETNTLAEKTQEEIDHHLSLVSDSNTVEEEKFPETPTSIEGLKKLMMFEKREMGAEESLDGSVVSEMECGDYSSVSIEQMKTALKAERKALSAIYAELEEERSASAIAANQTMAMITRLQEEKAAMQMEALQYQRMMEEQSEYDQEALQLLNELMTKREKKKQELENELEIYRKKVLEYEAREKVMMARARNGSSREEEEEEESDEAELSIDHNQEGGDFNTQMVLDCVKNIGTFDESSTEFEEEKQAILEQLKTLEEKLLTVGDEQFFEDLKSIENLASIKEFDERETETSERRSLGSMVKSLLPLLDAAEDEELEGSMSKELQVKSEALEMLNSLDSKFEMDHGKKVENEEEVDRVYERIQDLEVDKEFLQQCMSSIEKEDKGVDTLQEILQHLRDLRTMDLHLRTLNHDQDGEVALEYQE